MLMNNEEGLVKLVMLRQIIASSKGNIGLFWAGKNQIISTDKQTLSENVEGKTSLPEYLSIIKGHKKAWSEIDKNIKINNGGNPENSGWKSLPRGFVTFSTNKQKYFIVGGKWLNDSIAKQIAQEFSLDDYEIRMFSDYDLIEKETNL